MRMIEIIQKKKQGGTLTRQEIEFFVQGYTRGEIPDYQASALLMAICFSGMQEEETADLTDAMLHSGGTVDLSKVQGIVVDKHSTGGVGDTTTLVVVPWVASIGGKIAKMSGRGLGHTGGTLDKLESIPGFRVDLTEEEMVRLVNEHGAVICGQTQELVPADQKLYALRDVTATVDSIPLIASSVMSKKLASGADAIVLDVKTGSGAFLKEAKDAFLLAKEMVQIGTRLGRKVTALVTNMDQPLGNSIGNALDVREAVEILQGMHGESDLFQVCLALACQMAVSLGLSEDAADAKAQLMQTLASGKALEKFSEIIRAQGGESGICEDLSLLPQARHSAAVCAQETGYLVEMQAQKIGQAAQILGAGRSKKDDAIDPAVGIMMKKRVGDLVQEGEELATLYFNEETNVQQAQSWILEAVELGKEKRPNRPLILGKVTEEGMERWDSNGDGKSTAGKVH